MSEHLIAVYRGLYADEVTAISWDSRTSVGFTFLLYAHSNDLEASPIVFMIMRQFQKTRSSN